MSNTVTMTLMKNPNPWCQLSPFLQATLDLSHHCHQFLQMTRPRILSTKSFLPYLGLPLVTYFPLQTSLGLHFNLCMDVQMILKSTPCSPVMDMDVLDCCMVMKPFTELFLFLTIPFMDTFGIMSMEIGSSTLMFPARIQEEGGLIQEIRGVEEG